MSKKMLMDATHREEVRVAVIDQDRLVEFDFESSTKKQIKGNIYLAKVVRVEPSLQAAFVEYGGNRHGFLAFSEIHPDYYKIPVSDREELLASMRDENTDDLMQDTIAEDHQIPATLIQPVVVSSESKTFAHVENDAKEDQEEVQNDTLSEESIESLDEQDPETMMQARRRQRLYKTYKIQEVIKRRQVMLIQVVKEERGGKGAALTTYLSLAGRYCVLMPNSPRAGGVSRKITNMADRRRLRELVDEAHLPEGMGVIIRTAGMERTKIEIKRDLDYLVRLWEGIREQTLKSIAPALIHEEGYLIKKSIRDLYTKDIEEILVEGEEGYKEAKAFIRMLIPSHAKKVKQYKDPHNPLFFRYNVEEQIESIYNPVVHLKSGGYLIVNTTEALVAIDVNSGRSTKERHIEETAFKTNLEAAEEVARQLQLRDLAGLVVIDFIDMEDAKSIMAVEKRLKDCMKNDRARIQIGRISPFGLMELSRQRLRPSIIETSTITCHHCRGTGLIRSVESSALHVLRAIESEGIKGKFAELNVYVPTAIALYVLNQKRDALTQIEARYGISIFLFRDDALTPPDCRIERLQEKTQKKPIVRLIEEVVEVEVEDEDIVSEPSEEREATEDEKSEMPNRRRNRNRNRNRGRNRRREGSEPPRQDAVTGVEAEAIEGDKNNTDKNETVDLPPSSNVEGGENANGEEQPQRPRRYNQRRNRQFGRRRRPQGESDNRKQQGSIDGEQKQPVQEQQNISPSFNPAPSVPSQSSSPKTDQKTSRKGWWQRLLDN